MDVEKVTESLIQWIRDWFEVNGKGCKAIIGISGGKDSTVVAKLCVEALGKHRVFGVLMPNGEQKDISDSYKVVETLGINYVVHNIEGAVNAVLDGMTASNQEISEQTRVNLPPRIRMATLYAYAQSLNGRVANTCNLSETFTGYETRWGDSVGDFSPLGNLTVSEVREIGDYLNLPHDLVHKTPIDGLNTKVDGSYVTDEDILGFTYNDIDAFIKGKPVSSDAIYDKIATAHKNSEFKRQPITTFNPANANT
jgi:NAD+ synthase